jgi:hypothetical protein
LFFENQNYFCIKPLQMTLRDQLLDGDAIFRQIDDLLSKRQVSQANEIIQSTNPPNSWIIELQSIANPSDKFKSLKLELMEAIAKRVYGHYRIKTINQPTISQDKQGSCCVTIVVEVEIMSFDGDIIILPGIATEVVGSMRLLPLATPKASSMAVKNALKQLGRLFGKYLNAESDDTELPIVESKPTLEEQVEAVTQGIVTASDIKDLKSWRSLVYSKMGTKEQQELYETKLRQLVKSVN